MTLSIVARCADTGMSGVTAMTGTPGVDQLLAWAEADVGTVGAAEAGSHLPHGELGTATQDGLL